MDTIFEATKKNHELIFDDYININGVWESTTSKLDRFKNTIIISRDRVYYYYTCWNDEQLNQAVIFRRRHNETK